jgi:uncharacterized protein
MDTSSSIREQDKHSLIKIILSHLPNATIYLFGSRARQENTATSDIDLALDNGTKIDRFILSIIKESIEESHIPFMVDVVDFNSISADFRDQILKDKIVWYQPHKHSSKNIKN